MTAEMNYESQAEQNTWPRIMFDGLLDAEKLVLKLRMENVDSELIWGKLNRVVGHIQSAFTEEWTEYFHAVTE